MRLLTKMYIHNCMWPAEHRNSAHE